MQSLFAALLLFLSSILGGHHSLTVHVAPTPRVGSSTTQMAAVFNAPIASLQTPANPAATAHPRQPLAVAGVILPSAARSDPVAPASTGELTASLPAANYITQDELDAQLQIATNNLRSLIYSNTNSGTVSQVGQGQYASGGYTNEVALTNKIDQLTGTTLNNVTVNGISGITAANIPTNIVAANYLPLAGGTLTGALVDSATASSSFVGALGIGTSSPSDTLAVNGPVYLADIAAPSNTANRLYSNSGSLYWAGNLVGGGTVGNWTSSAGNVYRASGNVGIGTTSPATTLSVSGNGYLTGSLTASTLSLTGLTPSTPATFTNGTNATNLYVSTDPCCSGELIIQNNQGGRNTLGIQNLNSGGYSDLNLLDASGNEIASLGYKSGSGGVEGQSVYLEAAPYNGSMITGTPPDFVIVQGGTMGGTTDQHDRMRFGGDGSLTINQLPGGFHSFYFDPNGHSYFAIGKGSAPQTNLEVVGQTLLSNGTSADPTSLAGGYRLTMNPSDGKMMRLVKAGIGKTDIDFAGSSSGSTDRGLRFTNTDNSSIVPIELAMNGTGVVAFGGTGTSNILTSSNAGLRGSGTTLKVVLGDNSGDASLTAGSLTLSGNLGIGTTTPYSRLTVWGTDTASTSPFAVVNSASTTVFAVYDNGNATYSGSIFQSSDQRLKSNVQPLDASSSLSLIGGLNPVSYTRLDQTAQGMNLGFIAQQVQQLFPELVSTTSPTALTPDGTLTLNYVGLIAPIVAALQALMHQLNSLEATVAGFADNFISAHITVTTGDFQQVNTQKLCVGSACVTPAQFLAMIAAANQSPAAAQPGSAGTSTLPGSVTQNGAASTTPGMPPAIEVNGDNPAIIHVGDTYADFGATITGPSADLNLGIKTFLNGTLVSNIVLDTSSQATDTIDYVATDESGLTSTSTRQVIIEPTQPSPTISMTASTTIATTTTR